MAERRQEEAEPAAEADRDSWANPELECDLIMKGGVTSAVVYPRAIAQFGTRYRLRSVGGTSAGAIGAALAAAAEYGRGRNGFQKLNTLPSLLADGGLARLFQGDGATADLLPLFQIATGHYQQDPGRPAPLPLPISRRIALALRLAWKRIPLARLWVLPGVLLALFSVPVFASIGSGNPGHVVLVALVVAAGVLLALLGLAASAAGWLVACLLSVYRTTVVEVPKNMFGICSGLGTAEEPGLTDWLAAQIDDLAGIPNRKRPLLFGDLRQGPEGYAHDPSKGDFLDLRMMTTCLNRARPYELPFKQGEYYFDPEEWARLFPKKVMDALLADRRDGIEVMPGPNGALIVTRVWHPRGRHFDSRRQLHRLPPTDELPVVVAMRLSLSFPLLISAVPMYGRNLRVRPSTLPPVGNERIRPEDAEVRGRFLERLWFSDGGLCSNFPVTMFDAPLPMRPTFALNLGFADRSSESGQRVYRLAQNNNEGMYPPYIPIDETGIDALTGFGGAMVSAARNWNDNVHLEIPGHRDRIVEVLQTKEEGGLNMFMTKSAVDALASKGSRAAQGIMSQFSELRYPPGNRRKTATGWDNHRWIRFRALLNVLLPFLEHYGRGYEGIDVNSPLAPGYPFDSIQQRSAARTVAEELKRAAGTVTQIDPRTRAAVAKKPANSGRLRRTPTV